jgi:ABC-type sugar transport system substrate-binding protein
MRILFGVRPVLAGAIVLTAAVSAFAEDKPLTIGVSHQSLGFPYAVALQNGELKAAKDMGARRSTSIPTSAP